MKKRLLFCAGIFMVPAFLFAQTQQSPEIGTAAWAAQNHQAQRYGNNNVNPLNGSDTLNNIYSNTACGLNYAMASQRLGQRFVPIGVPQPAPLTLAAMPACAVIDKAYLYTEVLGVVAGINADLTDPNNNTSTYAMTNIGNSIDVCWGMNGTHVWRADVTASVTGPGVYTISGLPTSTTASMSTADAEGATLLVIYHDPYASYTGTLILDDGCWTVAAGPETHTMYGVNACANSTYGSAFMLVGDMQMMGYNISMNGNAVTQPQWNWWNEISATTSVTNGQSTCDFHMDDASDCYTMAAAGLYFQTGCSTCTPMTSNMTLVTTSAPESCNGNGMAAVSASGGSGNYTYMWAPGGQTTATISNLTAGTYTVYVSDGNSCTSATVTVTYTGMTLTTSSTPNSCSTAGSATVSVTGGVGPYTYSWSPAGGNAATANNLAAGNYTVTVTDATSCVMTASVTVQNNSNLMTYAYGYPDTCTSTVGAVHVTAYGGTPPYTYSWMPGGQTTADVYNLSAGSYTVIVTDALGCSMADTAVVTNLTSMQVYASAFSPVSCADDPGLYAGANITPATYSWSPSTYLNNPNIQSPTCTPLSTITYTVTATSQCGTATDSITIYVDSTNWYNEQICFVTVDTAIDKNVVIWERWNSPTAGHYNIYRETATSGIYALIASQPVSQYSTYTDMSSNPQVQANRYIITTVDSCGYESDTSDHHRTIFLQTTPNSTSGYDLSWNMYEGLPVTTYNVYSGPALNQLTLLGTASGTTYTDPAGTPGTVYLVEAVHPFGGCNPSRVSNPNAIQSRYDNAQSNPSVAQPDGIAQNGSLQNSLTISPNPGSGNFVLTMLLGNTQDVTIGVFDNLGRSVYAQQVSGNAGKFNTTMNLSQLNSGVYFVQVRTANGTATKRLVIN